MEVRILDLDGGIVAQRQLVDRCRPQVIPFQDWGPRIRLACSFHAFNRFESMLEERLRNSGGSSPTLTFCGSGDFHHVSLALLRRLHQPFNLLVLDKHPDWMRGVPLLHCGTWLHHALHLPNLQRVFHLGGDLDFDNAYRWLAPWKQIKEGKIVTIPAVRCYARGHWRKIANESLRAEPQRQVNGERLDALLGDFMADLERYPLYISLDKDVMRGQHAVVNWDSGHLELGEVQTILAWFRAACDGNLAGMDIVGDWSPVRVAGLLRRLLHATEHPRLSIEPAQASRCNAAVNVALLESIRQFAGISNSNAKFDLRPASAPEASATVQ